MQNFGLENHRVDNARQAFCWLMLLTKVSNPFLPLPRKKLQTYAFKIDRFWSISHFYSLWNNKRQNSQGEEGRNSYLLNLTQKEGTDVRT